MQAGTRKLTTWERTQVDVSKPEEVVGWCNKWGVTPERLKAAVADVGTSAVSVARALGKPDQR
jgi:2-hydroxychromene-2-carboxylate isomerase